MADTSPVSAFDRVQTRSAPSPAPIRPAAWKIAALVALFAVGIVAAIWLWPNDDGDGSFLGLLRTSSESYAPDMVTTDPQEAQAFIADALGWSIPPPDLPALALVGAGLPTVATLRPSAGTSESEVQVPVFRFEGEDGVRAHVYVYDYILLDRLRGVFDLPEATYAVLSEPTPVDTRVLDGSYVVTWRQRAMLFSALTTDETVAERIRQAVGT